MQLFETLRMDEGRFPRLSYHKARMKKSAEQLGFKFDDNRWLYEINKMIETHPKGSFRTKLLLNDDGTIHHEIAPLSDKQIFTAKFQQLAPQVPKDLVINKTTQRAHLEHNHQTDLILLYDKDEKILEFDIGNVIIKEKNQLYTPIYEADFLRGCKRQEMIDNGTLMQKNYYLNELKEKMKQGTVTLFLINSLREVAEVEIYL
ncbi:aminotransferase class IV [Staphylococcus edaphicus]|uniref:Aminodeoxychorismate lyase n=1 Tax=Staphylococcus edaphicus TaxID=1955013 RepID=A0A2C6U9C3_9STAP|nr:aminotransferase class IV [Staphylococcus edaphicus]PHK50382.1 aminodeoxychorismate lyase [Staphylococcus edaphicus]UQW81066.1 aminotransferase class IV [Staphylococcus edaphicus]